jgi:hypothetical protein
MFVCPIRFGFEIQPNRQFAERRFKSCEGVDQPSRHHPIDLYHAQDEVRRCVSTGSAMVPPVAARSELSRRLLDLQNLKLSTRIAAYIINQPLSAATKSTLLVLILWSVDANDRNLGE